jgi:signal transduction histidine kinase/sensor domain CHASE-containing protein
VPLSKKIILIIVSLIFLSFLFIGLTTGFILNENFLKLEKQSVERNVSQVMNSISTIQDGLAASTPDWAYWDDTYEFARGNNPSYIERNISELTFESNQIDLIVILDNNQNILFERAYNYSEEVDVPISPELNNLLTNPLVAIHTDDSVGISGLLATSTDLPLIISAYPILDSLVQGPHSGTLIFGIFLDTGKVSDIADLTISNVSLDSVNDTALSQDILAVKDSLTTPGTVITRPIDRKYVAGYTVINDIFDNPVMVLEVTRTRDVYRQGQSTFMFFGLTMAIFSFIFGIIELIVLRKTITSRFSMISQGVNIIGETGDISKRISVSGTDELKHLADNINNMLEKITETENQLRLQKKRFDRLLEFTPGVILIFDARATLLSVNKEFCTIFNVSEYTAVGKNLADFVPQEIITGIYPYITDEEGSVYDTEMRLQISGTEKLYSVTIITLYAGEYLLLGWDITQERRDMDRMYLTDRLATIGELTSGIAHELNNPLTSVIGLSGLLLEAELPAEVKNDLTTIFQEARRTSDIVKNLLTFARNHPASREDIDVNTILASTLDMRAYEQNLNKIMVIRKFSENLPKIKADAFQLQQVFLNLVVNAEYFMQEAHKGGCLTITTELVSNHMRITFLNDGSQIPEAIIKHIFDPFFTTKPVGKGTGLGLSISYGIITAHNGRIYAENLLGKGVAFIIELPINGTKAP